MGYKLAGYNVLGNVEIDKNTNDIYIKNNHPKFNYNMDIRDFYKLNKYPKELYNLDILDGSPPCTSFSIAGNREKDWGKEKKFNEGGKLQTLDDLFFDFLNVAEKLNPKIIIAENVSGLIKGNAKGYCSLIVKNFNLIGYDVQIFILNAATMGVPQSRERVFFIGKRRNLKYKELKLNFNEKPILFKEVRSEKGIEFNPKSKTKKILQYLKSTDTKISHINKRLFGIDSGYINRIIHDNNVCLTLTNAGMIIRAHDKTLFSRQDMINVSTFPQDYNCPDNKIKFICGMSVPPIMMAKIAEQIKIQWLNSEI